MLPLKSSSRFQLALGASAFEVAGVESFGTPPANPDVPMDMLTGFFEVAGVESFGMPPANLDVPMDMPRGFLAAARGMPSVGVDGKEKGAANCLRSIMIND